MSVAVKIISDKPVYMSFDRVTIMEMMPGESYEIPDGLYEKRKHLFQKLSETELAALAAAALSGAEPPVEAEATSVEAEKPAETSGDDSVQSAAVTAQNKTVRKFQSKDDDKK
jgi:hypothetical protein